MTLQQLNYIIAVNKFRNFAKAADQCGVTQPTLSKLISNLENELDIRIFERNSRHVSPTATGARIIHQAEKAIMEVRRIQEMADETKNALTGILRISAGPSIAPYLLPDFIRHYSADYPAVALTVEELRLKHMQKALLTGSIDIGIAAGDNRCEGIFEIPLYREPFWVYVSSSCLHRLSSFTPEFLSHENMWIMKEAQCLRESAFSFCKAEETGRRVYEAGNIETLVRVVDANGGFTIIPEMHLPLLDEERRKNVRPLEGTAASMRKVSLYIRHDYVRERILNSVAGTLTKVIPSHMMDSNILKRAIRL